MNLLQYGTVYSISDQLSVDRNWEHHQLPIDQLSLCDVLLNLSHVIDMNGACMATWVMVRVTLKIKKGYSHSHNYKYMSSEPIVPFTLPLEKLKSQDPRFASK